MKFYYESIGECVNQVYEVEADTWEDAKTKAFEMMSVGDRIAMCEPEAVKEYTQWPDYHFIDADDCGMIATLHQGDWVDDSEGDEYWEEGIYWFSDDPETYLDGQGNEFDDWKQSEEAEE